MIEGISGALADKSSAEDEGQIARDKSKPPCPLDNPQMNAGRYCHSC